MIKEESKYFTNWKSLQNYGLFYKVMVVYSKSFTKLVVTDFLKSFYMMMKMKLLPTLHIQDQKFKILKKL